MQIFAYNMQTIAKINLNKQVGGWVGGCTHVLVGDHVLHIRAGLRPRAAHGPRPCDPVCAPSLHCCS